MSHILISGGTRGIGEAVSSLFLDRGHKVTALYSGNEDAKNAFVSKKGLNSSNLQVFKCDVSDPIKVNETVKSAIESFDGIDVFVSNAGISLVGLADTFNYEDYRRIMDTNFGGFFNLTHEIIPDMVRRKSGVIIAISSMWGQTGASCEALYSASKGAVDAYVKSLAKELGPSGIRVNAVSPGVINTDMLKSFSQEDLYSLAEETPIGRIGEPLDIAKVVYNLSTDDCSFITGQIIGVNGGFLI